MSRLRMLLGMGIAVAALATGCATPGGGTPPAVPAVLQAAADDVLALESTATGVQIYECAAGKETPPRYTWTFRAPEADLFDRSGSRIGRHYAGPTWESLDGSKVVGELKARDDAPVPGAIPWLLLRSKSTAGKGAFGRTTSIQRVATVAGVAPGEGCGVANAGSIARVPYEATYYFYTARP